MSEEAVQMGQNVQLHVWNALLLTQITDSPHTVQLFTNYQQGHNSRVRRLEHIIRPPELHFSKIGSSRSPMWIIKLKIMQTNNSTNTEQLRMETKTHSKVIFGFRFNLVFDQDILNPFFLLLTQRSEPLRASDSAAAGSNEPLVCCSDTAPTVQMTKANYWLA